ncbi:unnamed protein product [Pleuronectes platessa]|uniref:Uncharacterized protein n=1 Tax=Pleuronectes platessa TaxID=8262 RepID=A0A9N7TRX5_PLEPL|nr:unnamed protein product [Pleuronectes platessa]
MKKRRRTHRGRRTKRRVQTSSAPSALQALPLLLNRPRPCRSTGSAPAALQAPPLLLYRLRPSPGCSHMFLFERSDPTTCCCFSGHTSKILSVRNQISFSRILDRIVSQAKVSMCELLHNYFTSLTPISEERFKGPGGAIVLRGTEVKWEPGGRKTAQNSSEGAGRGRGRAGGRGRNAGRVVSAGARNPTQVRSCSDRNRAAATTLAPGGRQERPGKGRRGRPGVRKVGRAEPPSGDGRRGPLRVGEGGGSAQGSNDVQAEERKDSGGGKDSLKQGNDKRHQTKKGPRPQQRQEDTWVPNKPGGRTAEKECKAARKSSPRATEAANIASGRGWGPSRTTALPRERPHANKGGNTKNQNARHTTQNRRQARSRKAKTKPAKAHEETTKHKPPR